MRCPVHNVESRHRGEIGILRYDRAIAQARSDGRDLNVDLLHGAADSAQLGVQSPKRFRSGCLERPNGKVSETPTKSCTIAIVCGTQVNARPKFAQDRRADADATATCYRFPGMVIDVQPAIHVIAGNPGIEDETPQNRVSGSSQLLRTSSFWSDLLDAKSRSINSCSSGVRSSGLAASMCANRKSIPSRVVGQIDSSSPYVPSSLHARVSASISSRDAVASLVGCTTMRVPSGQSTGWSSFTCPSRYTALAFRIICANSEWLVSLALYRRAGR